MAAGSGAAPGCLEDFLFLDAKPFPCTYPAVGASAAATEDWELPNRSARFSAAVGPVRNAVAYNRLFASVTRVD
jgi:hypothetical protein